MAYVGETPAAREPEPGGDGSAKRSSDGGPRPGGESRLLLPGPQMIPGTACMATAPHLAARLFARRIMRVAVVPERPLYSGVMLLLRRKKFFGSYFFLIWASFFRFRPNALETPMSVPSSVIPVKFRYVVPVPSLWTCDHVSRTHETTLSSSPWDSQLPSIETIQFAARSLYAVSSA